MTFAQAEQFLLSIVNIPRKEYMADPKHCKVYLDRLQFFLNILGNPEKQIPHYIHVAGTSGKGSVCNFLNQILIAAGYKTGMLQSPHPSTSLQRWQIGNKLMSKKELTDIVSTIQKALDTYERTSPYDMISYSELKTAIGLYYFASKKIDWCVLETACGGRYDSTNIVPNKDIAIVTNIGLDHVAILGNDKKTIAYEKAGIIKKESLAFTSEQSPSIRAIIESEAKKQKAPFFYAAPTYTLLNESMKETTFSYKDELFTLSTRGRHQIHNAVLAIEVMRALHIPEVAIRKGLRREAQEYRMELTGEKPYIIIDTAHNEDKIESSVHTLEQLLKSEKGIQHIHMIIGFSHDKKLPALVKKLARLSPTSVACTRNTINAFRKVHAPKDIQQAWHAITNSVETEIFLDPADAYAWTKKRAKKGDLILITGSVFLAGELAPLVRRK